MSAVPSKLSVPSIRNQVPRQRQVQALDGLLANAPIAWVLGLPGAGKTCTTAQWVHAAQARGERCIWYRLDEDDADVAGLISTLRHHAVHGNPGLLAASLPAWSPDNQPDPRRFAQRFFSQLAQLTQLKQAPEDARPPAPQVAEHGGAAQLSQASRLTLVFDDCHRVPDHGAFFEMLDAAREVAGDGLRLLLVSRGRQRRRCRAARCRAGCACTTTWR